MNKSRFVGALAVLAACVPVVAESTCARLAALALPDTTITLVESVAAGTFKGAMGVPAPGLPSVAELPAFCRVVAEIKPTKDSDIQMEVWMPISGWNGKFMGVGNGGWLGRILYQGMGQALARGYATANTDAGHEGNDASFALGHPEKVVDFGYRAVHEMTVKAKAIIAAYYGQQTRHSYWSGCSSGGRQGLKEAQQFPLDYDGIIAGAPANFMTHLLVEQMWVAHATLKDPASYIPEDKYSLIHKAVLDACDALDGVKDGVLEDPTQCHFDPKVLQCKEGDAPSCLTALQVQAARKIYGGAKNSRTGEQVFPGLEPGSENSWGQLAGGPKPSGVSETYFKYLVFKDPNWDFKTLNFDQDVALADKLDNGVLNATDPNLKQFAAHGGKLIIYHGWNDQAISPRNSVNYYNSVAAAMGGAEKVRNSIRLFMVPGMNHCSRGDGPSVFDAISTLDQWVEKGKAPDQMIASRYTDDFVDRKRPLCPYPQIAKYKGTGSIDEAANFVCASPRPDNQGKASKAH